MWRLLFCVLLGTLLAGPAEARKAGKPRGTAAQKAKGGKAQKGGKKAAAAESGQVPPDAAQRGCCKHHGGPCACEKNTIKCCDGTVSSLCGC